MFCEFSHRNIMNVFISLFFYWLWIYFFICLIVDETNEQEYNLFLHESWVGVGPVNSYLSTSYFTFPVLVFFLDFIFLLLLFFIFFFFLSFLFSSWSKCQGNFEINHRKLYKSETKSNFFFILFFAWNPDLKMWIRIVSFYCHIYLIITSVSPHCAFNFLLSRD